MIPTESEKRLRGFELLGQLVQQMVKRPLAASMPKVQVVTIKRSLQRALYTTWDQLGNQPDSYHIRRLAVQGNGPDVAPLLANRVGYFQIATSPSYQFVFNDPDHFGSWLPNTGEVKSLGKIQLQAGANKIDPTQAKGAAWTIARVWDYYGTEVADGNITTLFHLIAESQDTGENSKSVLPVGNNGNNLHPWVTGNEWNQGQDEDKEKKGGQIPFHPSQPRTSR